MIFCACKWRIYNHRCAASLEAYIETIELFLEFEADHFVCGHVNKAGTRAELEQLLEFVNDVVKAANVHFFAFLGALLMHAWNIVISQVF